MGGGGGSSPPPHRDELSGAACELLIYEHGDKGGHARRFSGEGSHNVQSVPSGQQVTDHVFGYNALSEYHASGKNCAIVGYTWHGGGKFHHGGSPHGDIMLFRDGHHKVYGGRHGHEAREFNDDIDGIRIQHVPDANSNQMQYLINIPAQAPQDFFSPRNVGNVKNDVGAGFDPCPGADAKYLTSAPGVKCIYSKTNSSGLKTLYGATKHQNMDAMLHALANEYCDDTNKAFDNVGGKSCLEVKDGKELAKRYCAEGARMKSDPNCTVANLGDKYYNDLASAFCERSPTDAWCQCYNVAKDKCGVDQKSGPSGCATSKDWVDLRNATPSEFKGVWNGKRQCYGRVCVGAGKYIPPNVNQGCDAPIQICAQSFNINQMSNSDIKASCEQSATASSSPSAGSQPAPTQDELEEARKAAASGDPAAEARLKELEDRLKESEENTIRAFIPTSLEDLKTNRKKQMGALGGVGSFMMIAFCMILLIVIASKGGRRSVRR